MQETVQYSNRLYNAGIFPQNPLLLFSLILLLVKLWVLSRGGAKAQGISVSAKKEKETITGTKSSKSQFRNMLAD